MISFLKKILKLLLAGTFTLIVAACYGVYVNYRYLFSVKNPGGAPLRNISISLIEDGAAIARDFTDMNGEVMLEYPSFGAASCDVIIEDIDGPENGGEFQTINTTVNGGTGEVTEYSFTMHPVE